jgi:hypothetical protein
MAEKTRSLAEMDRAHRRVARYVGIALIVGEAQHWIYLKTILRGLLTPRERAALAFSVMASLDPNQRSMVSHATAQRAVLGPPLATLADVRDDAEWWSRNASIQERKIYLMACLNRLSEVDRRDLTNYLTGRAAT